MSRDNCNDPTPYAVYCKGRCSSSGLMFLTEQEYMKQMDRPDSLWQCPQCKGPAEWDDYCQVTNPPDNFDAEEPAF